MKCRIVVFVVLLCAVVFMGCQENVEDVTIIGNIENPDSAKGEPVVIEIKYQKPSPAGYTIFRADLDKNNEFNFCFPLDHPQDVILKINENFMKLLVQPGKHLKIKIDLQKYLIITNQNNYNGVTFSGQGGPVNQVMADFVPKIDAMRPSAQEYNKLFSMSPLERKEVGKVHLQEERVFLNNYLEKNKVPPLFKVWANYHVEYYFVQELMRYATIHQPVEILRTDNAVSDNFFTFINDYKLENPDAMMCQEYVHYVNNFCLHSLIKNQRLPDTKAIFDIILEQGTELTADERTRFLSLRDEDFETMNQEDKTFCSKVVGSHQKFLDDFSAKMNIERILSRPNGFVFDVMLASQLNSLLEIGTSTNIIDSYLDVFNSRVENKVIKDFINKQYDLEKIKYSSLPEADIFKTPVNTGDSLLIDILKKYRGQVVYVDFWATWCGPCMVKMPHAQKLERELKDKGIRFVYICVDSPEKDYNRFLEKNNFIGDHYTANRNQYSYISQRFSYAGVPQAMIVNQKGIVVDQTASGPETGDFIKNDLLTVLEKQDL